MTKQYKNLKRGSKKLGIHLNCERQYALGNNRKIPVQDIDVKNYFYHFVFSFCL